MQRSPFYITKRYFMNKQVEMDLKAKLNRFASEAILELLKSHQELLKRVEELEAAQAPVEAKVEVKKEEVVEEMVEEALEDLEE